MTKKGRPEWNEIVAFARELLDHGYEKIMLELINAAEETNVLELVVADDGSFTLGLINVGDDQARKEELEEKLLQTIDHELRDLDDEERRKKVIKTEAEKFRQKLLDEQNFIAMERAFEGEMGINDYDAMVATAAGLLRNGDPLPRNLALFVADVLEGNSSRPPYHGPPPGRDYIRNIVFSFAVEVIKMKFGIARYESGDTNNKTAADAVGEAAKFSTNTVRNAFKSHRIGHSSIIKAAAEQLGLKLDG